MDEVNVLVVDDSAFMRNLISKIIESTPGLCVIGKAINGKFALEKIPLIKPDIIVLDIEMPEMNGIEFLKQRKLQNIDIPVSVLSSVAQEGAYVTMQCLSLGASDFITKPSSGSNDLNEVAKNLSDVLLSYGGQYKKSKGAHQKLSLEKKSSISKTLTGKNNDSTSVIAEKRTFNESSSNEKN